MFKVLAFSATVLLYGPCAAIVAQTAINYSEDAGSVQAAGRMTSPKARAEAKRLYKEGVKYGLAGLLAQSVAILEQATKLDPQNAAAYSALGRAYYDLKQWRKAIESLKVAVGLNPKDAKARDCLGLARAMLWEQDSAKIAAERREAPPPPQLAVQQISMNVKTAGASDKLAEAPAEPNATASKDAEREKELALTKIYRVGPNDVLDIRINDSSSQSTLFTITSSGYLEHPMFAEPLAASGLTVDEIAGKFESELKRRALIDNPKVAVGVRDYASHTILVSGLVKESGTKILRREAIPLYVVVADAQPLPEAARVTLLRNETNQTFEIDLTSANEMSRLVRPGDVITLVPNVMQFVYVGGEVIQPGEKTYRRGLTLTQVIIAAGGATARAKEARLARDDGNGYLTVIRIKLKEIESGRIQDPLLKPGDRIMIRN